MFLKITKICEQHFRRLTQIERDVRSSDYFQEKINKILNFLRRFKFGLENITVRESYSYDSLQKQYGGLI